MDATLPSLFAIFGIIRLVPNIVPIGINAMLAEASVPLMHMLIWIPQAMSRNICENIPMNLALVIAEYAVIAAAATEPIQSQSALNWWLATSQIKSCDIIIAE